MAQSKPTSEKRGKDNQSRKFSMTMMGLQSCGHKFGHYCLEFISGEMGNWEGICQTWDTDGAVSPLPLLWWELAMSETDGYSLCLCYQMVQFIGIVTRWAESDSQHAPSFACWYLLNVDPVIRPWLFDTDFGGGIISIHGWDSMVPRPCDRIEVALLKVKCSSGNP